MDFTYNGYRSLVSKLREKGYCFADYHNWRNYSKAVIFRHDIDCSIEKAVEMAKLESGLGVKATYFVLITGDFYNVFSSPVIRQLRLIKGMGHDIGLHFDETCYDPEEDMVRMIEYESEILSKVLGEEILAVSMHRPSESTLKADWVIRNGAEVNCYGHQFFHEFKYLSDSRKYWSEDVDSIIDAGGIQNCIF